MPYLDRFDYDIFLSHSWSNNVDEDRGDRKWVQDLKIKLERELRERMQGPVSIFLDAERPRNANTEDLFRSAIHKSAALLAIVTPGFCSEMSFCRKELDWFYGESRPISGDRIRVEKRIFKIVSRPVSRQSQPEKIREIPEYAFYEGDPGSNLQNYHRLGVNSIEDDIRTRISKEYARLVPALATFLDHCRQIQIKSPIKTVFLADSSSAGKGQVQGVLGIHDVISFPETPGMTEEEFVAGTEQTLASSDCSLHLVDTTSALTHPQHWTRSAFENQLFCARGIKKPNFQAIVWCDERNIQDPYLAELMKRTREEFVNDSPIKYISQGIQYLMSNLPAMVTTQQTIPIQRSPLGKRIFVQCVKQDIEKLENVFRAIESVGVSVQIPVYDGKREEIEKLWKKFLAETDGTLIYWGSCGDAYTYMLCDRAVETYGAGLQHKMRVIGIDPPDARRRRFTHPHFALMEFPLSEEQLRNAFP